MKFSEIVDRLMVVGGAILAVYVITYLGHCSLQERCLSSYNTTRSAAECGLK